MPNVSEKDLIRAAAKYILGEETHVKVTGSSKKIKAFQNAIVASRALYEALKDGKSMEDVSRLLEKKSRAARAYKETTGMTWLL